MGISSPHFKFPVFMRFGFYLLSIPLALHFVLLPSLRLLWPGSLAHSTGNRGRGGEGGTGQGGACRLPLSRGAFGILQGMTVSDGHLNCL